jgi:hypothetical protein
MGQQDIDKNCTFPRQCVHMALCVRIAKTVSADQERVHMATTVPTSAASSIYKADFVTAWPSQCLHRHNGADLAVTTSAKPSQVELERQGVGMPSQCLHGHDGTIVAVTTSTKPSRAAPAWPRPYQNGRNIVRMAKSVAAWPRRLCLAKQRLLRRDCVSVAMTLSKWPGRYQHGRDGVFKTGSGLLTHNMWLATMLSTSLHLA